MLTVTMRNHLRHVLYCLLVIAQVIAPVRGIAALAAPADAGAAPHCAAMQHDMQHAGHAGMTHASTRAADTGHCEKGCNGDCCDGSCLVCVHAAIALPPAGQSERVSYRSSYPDSGAEGCAGRSVHPPFRPPISIS